MPCRFFLDKKKSEKIKKCLRNVSLKCNLTNVSQTYLKNLPLQCFLNILCCQGGKCFLIFPIFQDYADIPTKRPGEIRGFQELVSTFWENFPAKNT